MSLFDGVNEAVPGAGGVYFLAGLYKVAVKKVFTMRSRKGDDLFIGEFKILESDCKDRKVGTSASWIVNFRHDAAMGNIRGFIAACNGIDPTNEDRLGEIDKEVCEYAVSDDNPLEGIEVLLEATNIETRAGTPFTLHNWTPVD
jgi:hypothetical protein